MIEDRFIVWKLKHGSRDALRQIYKKYEVYLLTIATALLNDRSAAEDVLHDTFVTLAQRSHSLRLAGDFRSYLATCVANRARDLMRKRDRGFGTLEDAEPLPAATPGPEAAAVFGEELECVARALAKLPYEQREVVILHLRGGLMFKQIARLQEVSVNTVQSRYRYGIEKLRLELTSEKTK
ncbi:RNA polymerase sigma factor [Planctomycetota bacterium]